MEPPPWWSWVVLIVLTMLSGMFSGLNLGLMSLTIEDLTIVIKSSSDEREIRNAQRILPLRKHGNLLLCTLLIGNTLVNVMLAVVTDPIWVFLFGSGTVGAVFALAVPSVLIVVFGEILPQSVCSRYALLIGAKTIPITYVFVVVTFVFAFPISLLLDRLLGEEMGAVYSRKGLLQLVKLNAEDPAHAAASGISKEDEKILTGALSFQDRTVGQVMTDIGEVFSLPQDAVLDKDTFLAIVQEGHTRIPVYEGTPSNIVGILLVNCLLGIGFERKITLASVLQDFQTHGSQVTLERVPKKTHCNAALDLCKRSHVCMLIVTEDGAQTEEAIGVVTIEDFIEEILQDEIVDEKDLYCSNSKSAIEMVDADTPASKPSLKRLNSKRVDSAVMLRKM